MTRNMIKYKDFNHYRAVIVFIVIFIAFNMFVAFVAIPATKPVPSSIGGAITLSIIYTLTCIFFSVFYLLLTSKD